MRLTFAALATAVVATLTPAAFAQGQPEAEDEGAPAGQKPEDVTIVVPSGSTTTVTTTGGGAPAKTAPAKKAAKGDEDEGDEDEKREGNGEARFRGGVSGRIGAFIPGPMFQLGPEGRLGAQIDDTWAVYADFGAHGGFGWHSEYDPNTGSAEGSVGAGGAVYASLMGEATIEDVFFVGVGPTIMYGAFVTFATFVDPDEVGGSVAAFAGGLPGIKLRVGFGIGKNRPDRRKQFTMAFDGTIVFGQRYEVTTSGTVDETTSVGIGVGFLPMLSLGYDAK